MYHLSLAIYYPGIQHLTIYHLNLATYHLTTYCTPLILYCHVTT